MEQEFVAYFQNPLTIILSRPPGPIGKDKDADKDAKSALESFDLFVDSEILDVIVKSTSIYIDSIKSRYQNERDEGYCLI